VTVVCGACAGTDADGGRAETMTAGAPAPGQKVAARFLNCRASELIPFASAAA
jgi:hypothetical protein